MRYEKSENRPETSPKNLKPCSVVEKFLTSTSLKTFRTNFEHRRKQNNFFTAAKPQLSAPKSRDSLQLRQRFFTTLCKIKAPRRAISLRSKNCWRTAIFSATKACKADSDGRVSCDTRARGEKSLASGDMQLWCIQSRWHRYARKLVLGKCFNRSLVRTGVWRGFWNRFALNPQNCRKKEGR